MLCVYVCVVHKYVLVMSLHVCLLLLVQWVQEKYMAEGWAQHHDHLVEFDEPEAEKVKPSIYVRVAEPADDDEKNWKVSIIGTSRVSCTTI